MGIINIKKNNKGKSNKIPSFTILELIIGLLISSIVITIVYYVLVIFNRQWMNYQSKSKQRNECLLLKKTMGMDIDNANAVTDSSDEKALIILVNFNQKIKYQAGNSYVIRVAEEKVDTLYCGAAITGVQYENDSTKLVTSFFLNVSVNKEVIPLFFNKEYTAKQLMKAPISE